MILSKQIKIAYVEDHLGIRKSVCDFLNGHENVEVIFDTDDGKELINFLKRNLPMPTVCILDITMPEMDGITLLQKIRRRWSKLPCMIYTRHRTTLTIGNAIHLGANGYLTKNYGYAELYQAILDIAATGEAYTNDVSKELFEKVRNHEIEVPLLTKRERLFLEQIGTDYTYHEIAALMGVSYSTVKGYRETCFGKLKVNSRATLVLEAIRLGIITI